MINNIASATRAYLYTFLILGTYTFNTISLENILSKQTKDILQIGGVIPEKTKQLEVAQKEQDELVREEQVWAQKINALLEENTNQRTAIKQALSLDPANDYLITKESILGDTSEVLHEIKQTRERRLAKLNEYIKLLGDFLIDPDFNEYRKECRIQTDRPRYSFKDLERVHSTLSTQEWRLAQIAEQDKNLTAELETYQKNIVLFQDELKKRREEIALAGGIAVGKNQGVRNAHDPDVYLNATQASELIQLLETLYAHKEQLMQIAIKAASYQHAFLKFQSFIEGERLRIIQSYLTAIKSRITITDMDIAEAREAYNQQKKEVTLAKDVYRNERTRLASEQKKISEYLDELSKHYASIPPGNDLGEWTRESVQSADWYSGMCRIGAAHNAIALLARKQALIDTRITLEDEKLRRTEMHLNIKETYRKIKQLILDEAIAQEISRYEKMRLDTIARFNRQKELVSTTANLITDQKKILENMQLFAHAMERERLIVFRNNSAPHTQCLSNIKSAEQSVQEHIRILGQLTSIHSEVAAILNSMVRSFDFIITELQTNSLWHRPEDAISWEGFKNAPGDILHFFADLRRYVAHLSFTSILHGSLATHGTPWDFATLIFKIAILVLFFVLFALYAPLLSHFFIDMSRKQEGLLRMCNLFLGSCIIFLRSHLWGVAIFSTLFGSALFYHIQDPYVYVIFFLILIPYLLYLANRFIAFLISTNAEYEYIFITEEYQRRFSLVLSFLLYTTIVISLFRTAFMLVHYPKSELPTILWAFNYIIFQISLILLISQQILYFIPTHSDLWLWIRAQVDRYYYVILFCIISIIILSHPHVGLGQLVRRSIDGLIRTAILLAIILWLHGLLKRTASRIFFSTAEETIRERFSNARTWFGLLIISSFVVLGFFGFIFIARIWGWHIVFSDMRSLLNEPLFGRGTDTPIAITTFLKLLGFALAGILLAHAVNRFVFDRIFDLLPVDSGVQHTISSLSQYLIVIIALYIGFNKVGLGQQINVVAIGLVLALGWIIKEPATDFIAYFIILVQRPIKIGDFIRIDAETFGVVRKITARAVVLRRKNSTTIIVSNSNFLNKSIANWNYSRNYIAFDDIVLTVDFKEDPNMVRELLREMVESHPNVLRNPKPIVRLENFAEYGFTFLVRGFLGSVYTLEQWNIASDIRLAIAAKLQEKNIKFALPLRFLDRSAEPPIEGEREDNNGHISG